MSSAPWPPVSVRTGEAPPRLRLTLVATTRTLVDGGAYRLFEGEVAGQGLAEDRELDAGARDAQVRAGGKVDRGRLAGDREVRLDRGGRVVELELEAAGERHAGRQRQRDVAAERCRQGRLR